MRDPNDDSRVTPIDRGRAVAAVGRARSRGSYSHFCSRPLPPPPLHQLTLCAANGEIVEVEWRTEYTTDSDHQKHEKDARGDVPVPPPATLKLYYRWVPLEERNSGAAVGGFLMLGVLSSMFLMSFLAMSEVILLKNDMDAAERSADRSK